MTVICTNVSGTTTASRIIAGSAVYVAGSVNLDAAATGTCIVSIYDSSNNFASGGSNILNANYNFTSGPWVTYATIKGSLPYPQWSGANSALYPNTEMYAQVTISGAEISPTLDKEYFRVTAAPAILSLAASPTGITSIGSSLLTGSVANMGASDAAWTKIGSQLTPCSTTNNINYTVWLHPSQISTTGTQTATFYAFNTEGRASSTTNLTITQSTMNSASLVHDLVVYLRDLLLNNVTDPSAANRPTGSRFVCTAFPERLAYYPLITIEETGFRDKPQGMSTDSKIITINIRIRIYSKSTKQRDDLWDAVYNLLRTGQYTNTIPSGLHDFKVNNVYNIDELGKEGVHTKIADISFDYYT